MLDYVAEYGIHVNCSIVSTETRRFKAVDRDDAEAKAKAIGQQIENMLAYEHQEDDIWADLENVQLA